MIKRRDFHHECKGCGRKEEIVVCCQCIEHQVKCELSGDLVSGSHVFECGATMRPLTIFVMPCHGHTQQETRA